VRLKADRAVIGADGEDVAIVAVEITDQQGRVVPTAGNKVSFAVSGSGKLIGVGNGDPTSHEPDKALERSAFNGLCMAIVQASKTPGRIRVDATAEGLASASLFIDAAPVKPRPAVA
jgi:beta-galactosidase